LSPTERLVRDAALLGVSLSPADAARLFTLLDELERWNRSYNLTAIGTRAQMITHHLLDSLSISPDLTGARIADAGTGAGFPGLPLALANPQRHFTLIDSTAKKIRFVSHAAELLGLENVRAVQARVERFPAGVFFDTVVARAFGPLPRLVRQVAPLCGPATRVLAMKGRRPEAEIAALPRPWRVAAARELEVPGLAAARCVLMLSMGPPHS
jgi:16S rRNA (guanine527-N7)-methyltransferase